jgi:hypothetical protein
VSERNNMINATTCLAEVEMLRAAFGNVATRIMFRLNDGPDPKLNKEWMEFAAKTSAELLKWQDRFYVQCKRDLP